jgi:hypothetical protein
MRPLRVNCRRYMMRRMKATAAAEPKAESMPMSTPLLAELSDAVFTLGSRMLSAVVWGRGRRERASEL